MLGVGLREHHQLNVARVALKLGKRREQVIDLVLGERQAEVAVGADEGGATEPVPGGVVMNAGSLGVRVAAARSSL